MVDNGFDCRDRKEPVGGFSLIELMVALVILTCGLLAAAPLLSTTIRLTAQARSKSTAALAAQDTLEHLADLCRRNPSAEELAMGSHRDMPWRDVVNPLDSSVLDRYAVEWDIDAVPDPRPGAALPGRMASVRVTPVDASGEPVPDKALIVNAILGMEL